MEKLSNNLEQCFLNVEENLKRIREGIAETALKSGHAPEDIVLLAATKTVPVEVINYAVSLGVRYIGENRVQELTDKYEALNKNDMAVHFIGHLQTNKVKYLTGRVDMIESVDSFRLAEEISRLSERENLRTDILLEVNIGREKNKSGVDPDGLFELAEEIATLPGIKVKGLMAIPPADANNSQAGVYFSKMFQYYVDIRDKKIDNVTMAYLSMGMSADYKQAIAAGSNLVRVGSALFGARIYR